MITAFSDLTILKVTIFFKVVDARGVIEEGEGRGVASEVLTKLWHLFYQSLSVGASAKVPTIRRDYQRQEWKAVARILLYGYCKEGASALSFVCVHCVLYACIEFCMRVLSFVCVYCVLYACIEFCMRALSFVCVYCVLFACIVLCMRVLSFVCVY
jgi:hypothetical protein